MKKTFSLILCVLFLAFLGCVVTPRINQPSRTHYDTSEEAINLYNLGVIAYDSGNFDAALEYLNQALQLWSGDVSGEAKFTLKRAQVYSAMGKLDLSLEDIKKVTSLSPNMPEAYYEMALLQYKKGNIIEAENDLDIALSIDPGFAHAYNLRGGIYRSIGNLDLAIEEYNLAIGYDDSYAPYYYNRAQAEAEKGDYASAIADYSEALMKYSDDQLEYKAQAHCMRADVFLMMGNFKMAEKDKAKAESLYPGICGEEEDVGPKWGKGEFRP